MTILVRMGLALSLLAAYATAAWALDDPTRPPQLGAGPVADTAAPVADWQVTSILIAGERKVAVVNGHSVVEGGQVGGAEIVRIAPTEITLRGVAGEFTVKLLSQEVRMPAAAGH